MSSQRDAVDEEWPAAGQGASEPSLGHALKRAQIMLRRATDDALRELELTTPQYMALDILRGEGGLSNAEMARRSRVTPQTMNGIITNLEASGLARREAGPGVVLRATLTERGRTLLKRADKRVLAIESRMSARLNDRERALVTDALARCAAALEDG